MAKPKKKKGKSLKAQAKELAWAEYGGAIGQVSDTRTGNRNQYDSYTKQRQESLSRQLGSDQQTNSIVGNTITGRKGEALGALSESIKKAELTKGVRDQVIQAQNANALSNYEAEMAARGLSTDQVEGMKANQAKSNDFRSQLDSIQAESANSAAKRTGSVYDILATQNAQAGTSAAAGARAQAQSDLTNQFNQYTSKDSELAAESAKLKKDRGSSRLNTYMTLKKEHQQRKAEKAQLALEQHIAGLKNSQEMAKVASSDYFKEAGLQLKRADLELKGKALDAKIKAETRKGNLEEAKLLEKIRDSNAKNRREDAKAGVSYGSGRNTGRGD